MALPCRTRRLLPALTGLALAACAAGPSTPLPTVPAVDLNRYLGTWYEIASIPNRFQSQCVADTQARYALKDQVIQVLNQCRRADGSISSAEGIARPVKESGNSKLRVSFFRPFYGDYWILALDPAYRWAVVGEPDRRYAWILARDPMLDAQTLGQLLERARQSGYDPARFKTTPHTRPIP